MQIRRVALALLTASLLIGGSVSASASPTSGLVQTVFAQKVSVTNLTVAFSDASKTTLGAQRLAFSPKSAKITYQWLKDGQKVRSGTSATYKYAPADTESAFQLRVTIAAKGSSPVTVTSKPFVPGDQPKDYKLIWADEFDASSASQPVSESWSPQDGDGTEFGLPGWGNNEEQYYLASQSTVKDGSLAISATREGASAKKCYYGDCQWLSSKFVTKGKVGFQYGRLEARIKTSSGQGVWPAFWLLGANIDTRSWPGCGEIDIMELKGQELTKVWGTVHGPNGSVGDVGDLSASDITGWHTYAIDWTPTAITWFIDGKRFNKVTKKEYVGQQDPRVWVFDHEFYLIVNLAMGGNFVGGPTDSELKSAKAEIDYVRYYTADGLGTLTKH